VTDRSRTDELRDFARLQVRAGLYDAGQQLAEVAQAIEADLPQTDAPTLARAWLTAERASVRAEQEDWPVPTDHDRLQEAFAGLERGDIVVLQGVEDHWTATDRLARETHRGVAWFTHSDVWHAIDEGMLEVNLWHGSTANVAPGDVLLEEALATFAGAGLAAHFDEGRIEVTARWQRRLL
jgi:hypothetical protein